MSRAIPPGGGMADEFFRRGVRVVEGARLESVYTAYPRIAGSNPALSASFGLIAAAQAGAA